MLHDSGVEVLIDFGTGDHRRMISLNRSFELLGYSFTKALLFFHAFTGCDSTSSFFGKTKTFWFNQIQSYSRNEEVTEAFAILSWTPLRSAAQDNMAEIELFVSHCYGQTDISSINEARFQIFTSSVSGNLRELPPSRSSLTLHVMRSAYQSGWIWGNSVSKKACPPVAEWGWFCTDEVRLQIEWCKLDTDLELMALATLVIANNPVRRISLKYYFKA